jgi:NADH-quinone oxidoreductase E subunit
MTNFKFTEENLKKVDETLKKYPLKKPAVMPVLWIAQEQNGWISGEVMKEVASILDMTPEDVLGVVSFYTMYHQKPMGKYHIQVCTNVSCMLKGANQIYDRVKKKLGLNNMEVSDDMQFSVEEVECMGSCGTAPMIAVNEDYFENLDLEKTEKILESLKNKN